MVRRALVTSVLAIAALQLLATTALAGPDWCDDGSPPPNDWGFQGTGGRSLTSPTSWLKSTSWSGGTYQLSDTTWLSGGTARGMKDAGDHATRKPNQRH